VATAAQITEVRGYVAQTSNTAPWDDATVGAYIDRTSSLYKAAEAIWAAKAAGYASLVNVSESGSSRQLGDLQSKALEMAKYYRGLAADVAASPPVTPVGPVISSLTRP
jgi:hypothetical protein